jgi:ferrochelatase
MKVAVVLFNLGGPDSLEAVEPFLRNLFSDPAVIDLPAWLRLPLARLVAKRRAPVAREIYAKIGGRSPILDETRKQALALQEQLNAGEFEARCVIAMRCAVPFSDETARAVHEWNPDRIVLLPLYPQYSTTTTRSSIADWQRASAAVGISAKQVTIGCFPSETGLIEAEADLIHSTLTRRAPNVEYRLLLSAHGLPERTISKGDPYRWQVERTAASIVEKLGIKGLDFQVCYQSRIGPLRWIGPSTAAEIERAGREKRGVIVAPIAFVSEHSETLVELDIEYAELAARAGVADYLRVPTVGTHPKFIAGLCRIVTEAAFAADEVAFLCGGGAVCPPDFRFCACRGVG